MKSREVLRMKEDLVTQDGCVKAAVGIYNPLTTYNGTKYGGTCIKIFETLMDSLGLCYKYIESPNGLWGIEDAEGNWDGLVGLAQRKEVELIVCPVVATHRRFKVVDFAKTVSKTFYFILYPRPKIMPNIAGFIMPFSYQSWIAIFGAMVAIILLSLVINKLLSTQREWGEDTENGNARELSMEIWLKGIISQPIDKIPRRSGGRLLMGIYLIAVFILGVVFKSNLKALLIVPKVEIPFDTLEELVNQNEYKWSFLAGSIIPQFFEPAYKEDKNSVRGKGWSRRGQLYKSSDQILPFVIERQMACISLSYKVLPLLSEDFSKTGKCRLAVARERILNLQMTFALRKGSKLTPFIDPLIMNLNEFGILEKMLNEGSSNASYCNVPPGHENGIQLRPLTIVDFMGVFCILAGGFALASFVFAMEICASKFSSVKNQQP